MKYFSVLAKVFVVLLFSLFVNVLTIKAQSSIYTIPAGAKILVRMDNEINSKVSSINDTFTAVVAKPFFIRDVEIIPVGTIVEGKILAVKPASSGRINGDLTVRFHSFQLPNDVKRIFDARLVESNLVESKSSPFRTISILGGTAIGAVLGAITGKGKGAIIGAGVGAGAGIGVSVLSKGKEARIKANQDFEIRLNQSVTVPVKDF